MSEYGAIMNRKDDAQCAPDRSRRSRRTEMAQVVAGMHDVLLGIVPALLVWRVLACPRRAGALNWVSTRNRQFSCRARRRVRWRVRHSAGLRHFLSRAQTYSLHAQSDSAGVGMVGLLAGDREANANAPLINHRRE